VETASSRPVRTLFVPNQLPASLEKPVAGCYHRSKEDFFMSNDLLKAGVRGEKSVTVTAKNTAAALGSGCLPVFATPAMIALMELCAAESVGDFLADGQSTVGTRIDVKHLSATPVGLTVRCETELVEIDRRRLVFACKAFDEAGLVGEGTQERFIVDNEKFMDKAGQKKA